jgi:hypothetical protein
MTNTYTGCRTCKHWQCCGSTGEHNEYADCYRVIGTIEPKLFEFRNERGYLFNVPFDPHDVHLYDAPYVREGERGVKKDHSFRKLYEKTMSDLPDPLRSMKEKGIKYIQTPYYYHCTRYERRKI